ncbi:hypothetical protein P168DRAFT_288348 [Aspergillus campestris IBT 28561]|uniref:N-acetyltransferase domain-containing protein n=1 Tax=Aspergillus campestris (strain IBT 28561) TaxID=1392248 RepID=A0A2I1D950_ASPC2|nr:uncharacterized protein P168DRAFT_288348 [Aspergillus campestris IBT 28561]PKY06396.1 hypothetical protein P168DRAFT_288348 [Aspergillus campestris IBT 28561]
MAIDIVLMTERDIPAAVQCVQTAFAEDPYFCWLFTASRYNIARNAASLTAHFQYGLNCNAPMYIALQQSSTPDKPARIVGVSWWFPPSPASPTWTTLAQDWLLSARQLVFNIRFGGRGGLNLRRYRLWKALQRDAHAKLWTDPQGYYFCNVLAVDEAARGMGVGRKLVEVVTRRADREGRPCYLESSRGMPNLVIYGRMGFEVVGEVDCVDGGDACKLYCMVRQPKVKA